jgi:hypothetical protein
MDERGHIVLKKRLTWDALLPFIVQLPPLVIGMEACGGAHYLKDARNPRLISESVKKQSVASVM